MQEFFGAVFIAQLVAALVVMISGLPHSGEPSKPVQVVCAPAKLQDRVPRAGIAPNAFDDAKHVKVFTIKK